MSITQPQSDVTLPEELQRAIVASRNAVTMNEAEAIRLRELAQSSQFTVNELHKSKVELESAISVLEERHAVAEKRVAELLDVITTHQNTRDALLNEIDEKRDELAGITEKIERDDAVIVERYAELEARESACSEKERQNVAERALLDEKAAKFKELADLIK